MSMKCPKCGFTVFDVRETEGEIELLVCRGCELAIPIKDVEGKLERSEKNG